MDLSFGPEYDDFRADVVSFLANNADKAPKASDLRGEAAKDWQKLLIENGYTRSLSTRITASIKDNEPCGNVLIYGLTYNLVFSFEVVYAILFMRKLSPTFGTLKCIFLATFIFKMAI